MSWQEGDREQAKQDGREIQVWKEHVPMETTSTYMAEFKARKTQPERRQSCKSDAAMPKTTPFEGGSTYREQFPWRKTTPREKAVAPKACGWEPQPHAQPMQSTYNSQFEWRSLPDRTSAKPAHVPIPYAPFDGETTSHAQFKWHSGVHKRESLKAQDTREHVAHPFAGKSTYADAYKAYSELPPVIARKPEDERQHTGLAKFDGSTAHREQFKEMRLPPGSSWELGVQVVGGRFHHLIARGKRPPCEGRATFTTVVDMQESVEIVVVGRAPNVKSLHLGHFELGGVAPNKIGIPQIIVTLQLDESFKLRVTALDKQRNHTRQMTLREIK